MAFRFRQDAPLPSPSPSPSLWLPLALACLAVAPPPASWADWPQWRGPLRNGLVPDAAGLPAQLEEGKELVKIWETETIPSDHYGGHGSVVIAGGKAFVGVVWHRDEPTEIRKISEAMGTLDHRGTDFSPELIAKMEADRLSLNPRLRGKALDEWGGQWVKDHLTEKQAVRLGSWVIGRFRQGKTAIPMEVYDKLRAAPKEFPSQAEMEAWVKAQSFETEIAERVIKAVPNTHKLANDVVLAFDLATGQPAWRFETPGLASDRSSSSTPVVVGGLIHAPLSGHVYTLEAATGGLVWKTPLAGRKGPASSPLVEGETLYLQEGPLRALNRLTGEVKWENKEVGYAHSSPVLWRGPEGPVLICNTSNQLFGIHAESGATLWKQPGGGDSTPTVSGDFLAVVSPQEGQNLSLWKLGTESPTLLWKKAFVTLRYSASPIIQGDYLYHLESDRHLCVRLSDGETAWERPASSNISSPMLADGKLFVYENNGGFLAMIKADGAAYTSLGRSKVGALRCASPSLVGRRLYLRTPTSVACYEFPEQ